MNDPWKDRLSEHLDGEFSPGDARALEAHLGTCASCRAALDDLRRIVRTARELPARAPERDLWPAIEARLSPAAVPSRARRDSWKASFALAATVVIALGAMWILREDQPKQAPAPPGKSARYLLLLHERVGHKTDATSDEVANVVDEYRRWAQDEAAAGRLLAGEKLADRAGWILRPGEQDLTLAGWRGSSEVGGYFLIAAADDDEAREIARGCPHLAHDGWIEVRPIDDPNRPKNRR